MNDSNVSESHYNPCLIGRKQWLAPLGDALAGFFVKWFEEPTGGCPCCIAVRVLTLTAAGVAAGTGIGLFL